MKYKGTISDPKDLVTKEYAEGLVVANPPITSESPKLTTLKVNGTNYRLNNSVQETDDNNDPLPLLTSLMLGDTAFAVDAEDPTPTGGAGFEIPIVATYNSQTEEYSFTCDITYAQLTAAYSTYKNNMYASMSFTGVQGTALIMPFSDIQYGSFQFTKTLINNVDKLTQTIWSALLGEDDDSWTIKITQMPLITPNPTTSTSTPLLESVQIGPDKYRIPSGGGGGVTVDDFLSPTSENPVQNKIVTDAIGYKASNQYVNEKTAPLDSAMETNGIGWVDSSNVTHKIDVDYLSSGTEASGRAIISNGQGGVTWGDSGKINDVQLNGTSIVSNKVANIVTVDNVTSAGNLNPLTANQGKILNDRMNNLESLGRYLSQWDCTIGKPATDPTTLPYTYKTGDYYRVSKIAFSYRHTIVFSSYNQTITAVVDTNSSAQMNFSSFRSWLINNGYNFNISSSPKYPVVQVYAGTTYNVYARGGIHTSSSGTFEAIYVGVDIQEIYTADDFSSCVDTVTTLSGANYKPSGNQYTGAASTVTTTENIAVGDFWFYDGTNWTLMVNHIGGLVTDVYQNGQSIVSGGIAYVASELPTATAADDGKLLKYTSANGPIWSDENTTISALVDQYMQAHYENGETQEY